jgi:methyl halide transferase
MLASLGRQGCFLTGVLVAFLACWELAAAATSKATTPSLRPCFRTSQLLEIAKSTASYTGHSDSYDGAASLAFGAAPHGAAPFTAFEENRYFVYALGTVSAGLTRRLVILKPSIFVIEDQAPRPSQELTCLYSESSPSISAGGVRVMEAGGEISWESPRPQQVSYSTTRQPGDGPEEYLVQATSPAATLAVPSLHMFYVLEKGHAESAGRAKLVHAQDAWELTVAAGDRVIHLWLPFASTNAGEIAVSTANGKALVDRQPLPSGILPHGPEGNRLLETWDADYRGPKPPAWDIGRPSDELQKVVNGATVGKCRAVDLCCGSGTDAIFLASHGFEVTAVDVAPTALAQARQKADQAGVTVRWVLADVLNPPNLEPFDFLYDRGCYHVVRDQSLLAYLETVRRISHPGSQFLLLSARREEQAAPGAPGVTEEELRFDFLPMFDVEWLRQTRLESNETGSSPPGWCALLRRNSKP